MMIQKKIRQTISCPIFSFLMNILLKIQHDPNIIKKLLQNKRNLTWYFWILPIIIMSKFKFKKIQMNSPNSIEQDQSCKKPEISNIKHPIETNIEKCKVQNQTRYYLHQRSKPNYNIN
ncbi:unnamed protein product [Paramecium sonneborni]|uniref:Uncharacterized protein n=1 Tax=Paramecium sonneborni TaxID=65129 RepID=A0A8S1Q6Q7_9CILI|nr:unnamed protein product [Paramecium sonneborni]